MRILPTMAPALFTLALSGVGGLTACCPAKTVAPVVTEVPPGDGPQTPTPERPGAPAAPAVIDEGIAEPDSGFWRREGPGAWRYDLGVGLSADIQLTARGEARGLVRVALPPGASRASLRALTVMYAKNHPDMAEAPGAASGTGRWHVHADEAGAPGLALGVIEATIDDANAAPLEDGNDGITHSPAAPIEVPATFWLVFERTSGDPRVAAMFLGPSLQGTYADLFFKKTPDAPLGEPLNYRPYVAIVFEGLSR